MKEQEHNQEFVDFAITSRKYKTLLTKKYKERKAWEKPNIYEIHSVIPGTVLEIYVKEGDIVELGTPLMILEAMKMQNRIDMPFKARIKKIDVEVGVKIPKKKLMIELEPVEV